MREFLRAIQRRREAGEGVVLVTVLSSGGSTPRGAGAMMACFSGGESIGTIGGGSVEHTAQALAAELLIRRKNALHCYHFTPGDAAGLGMVCGGDVTVHFHYLAPEDAALTACLAALRQSVGEGQGVWLLRRLEGAEVRETRAVTGGQDAALEPLLAEETVFQGGDLVIPISRPGTVWLFGGGHVSQALARVLEPLGFRIAVYDDRPEFTAAERFPMAAERIAAPFAELSRRVTVSAADYLVVMTRGHQADHEVLRQVLRSPARYLGCIGSRRKLALCRELLLEEGFTAEEYARLHAPIGLAIGAETPQEIAISVAAELVAVRSGKLP